MPQLSSTQTHADAADSPSKPDLCRLGGRRSGRDSRRPRGADSCGNGFARALDERDLDEPTGGQAEAEAEAVRGSRDGWLDRHMHAQPLRRRDDGFVVVEHHGRRRQRHADEDDAIQDLPTVEPDELECEQGSGGDLVGRADLAERDRELGKPRGRKPVRPRRVSPWHLPVRESIGSPVLRSSLGAMAADPDSQLRCESGGLVRRQTRPDHARELGCSEPSTSTGRRSSSRARRREATSLSN